MLRPILFRLETERAHRVSLRALSVWSSMGAPFGGPVEEPLLATRLAGLDFANPVGLAAGVDKDATAIDGLFALGFGSVEIGTLTPLAQPGNPRPRLFRLVEDRAVINRMGFNNAGLAAALPRVAAAKRRGVLGINVGANKDATAAGRAIDDYAAGVALAAPYADYLTINVSSPNTPGLRDLQGAALPELLAVCRSEAAGKPLFLKVAPDLDTAQIDAVARAAIGGGMAALIVGNTTTSRPALRSHDKDEAGGLSGTPLTVLARGKLADFRHATGGQLPLVAAGGVDSAEEAYARIRAGASLVQLYTALVYDGPGLPRRMARGLAKLLRRDGFARVADAVGIDAP